MHEELAVHLAESIRCHRRAIELKPDNGQYFLGLASVIESGESFAIDVDLYALLTTVVSSHASTQPATCSQPQAQALDPRAADLLFVEASDKEFAFVLDHQKLTAETNSVATAKHFRQFWHEKSIRYYFRAYELALPADEAFSREENFVSLGAIRHDQLGSRLEICQSCEGARTSKRRRETTCHQRGADTECHPSRERRRLSRQSSSH